MSEANTMTTQTEAMKLSIANDLVKYAELVEDEALISPEEMNCASLMRLAAEILANHIPDTTKMVAQPEQEPVAWMRQDGQRVTTASDRHNYPDYETRYSIPLYTTPPQRTWVGLTDGEKYALADDVARRGVPVFEAICEAEAKLKEKNT